MPSHYMSDSTVSVSLTAHGEPTLLATTMLSTKHDTDSLLHAFLSLGLPELSSAENFCAVETYVRTAGRRNRADDELPENGRTERGLLFWVYPSRLWGPYRKTVDKETGRVKVERHGLLMTVEEGARVGDVLDGAREGLTIGVLRHVHVRSQ